MIVRAGDRRSPWQVRRAGSDDAEAVATVWLRTRRAAAPAIPSSVHTDDDVRAWISGSVLAERETWVVDLYRPGDVVAVLVLDDSRVDQLYVDPDHQGRGIGAALLQQAKTRSPNGLDLWTFEANVGARRFYERGGFAAVVRTDGDNEEHAPDVRYRWPAPPSAPPPETVPPTLRPAVAADRRVLVEALALAADWRPRATVRSVAEVLADPAFAHYVSRWGTGDDAGVIVVGDRPLGAAWWTFLPATDPGYGFVDDTIPEVSIGVVADARGRGLGTALLDALVAEARRRSLPALSLSVEIDNPAITIYRRLGFRPVGHVGGAATMVADLAP